MNLTVKEYNGLPEYNYIVLFNAVLLCSTVMELELWCSQNLKSKWWSDIDTRRNSDRFWFADEQDAMLFMLRWS